jgi:hypothetical protein
MKKLILPLLLAAALLSCKKEKPAGPVKPLSILQIKMLGSWNFVSVTTVFTDTTGNTVDGAIYATPAGSYYQFNADGTWGSKFVENSLGLNNKGLYRTVADTGFYLLDTGKFAYSEKCKIYTLTNSEFTFSHSRYTTINGTTPVKEEYIFKLTK